MIPPTPDKVKPVGEEELMVVQGQLMALGDKETHLETTLREVVVQRVAEREKAAAQAVTKAADTQTKSKANDTATRTRQPLPKESKPSDFEVLKQLGKGAFGTVLKVRRKCDDALYALKVLKKKDIVQNDQVAHIIAERNTLLLCSRLGHPFLVGMHASFQTRSSLYLVMDYMECGDLYHYLRKEKRFSEARGGLYAAETILAVEHLHYLDIVHRDLKPENVLLDSDGHTRLTDFGLCKEHVRGPSGRSNSFCGTPEYMSPEVLLRKGHGKSVDWWCFGVLLFEMLTGDSPFYSPNLKRTYFKICNAQYKIPETVELSSWVVSLLKGLLQTDPGDRLGCNASDAEELKSHPFFSKYNWNKVIRKEMQPEYVPEVKDPSNPDKAEKKDGGLTAQLEADHMEEEPQSAFYGFSYQSGTTVQRKDLVKNVGIKSSCWAPH